MRALLILAAALVLGGCNMVYAEEPLFFARDAEGAAPLRPGVWAQRKPDCDFDASKKLEDWPECAGGAWVTADRIGPPDEPEKRAPYVLAGGDPRVLQFEVKEEGKTLYIFAGVKPLKLDDRGRIVEMRTWMVQCGPPPPPKPPLVPDAADEAASEETVAEETPEEASARIDREMEAAMSEGVTKEPLPGLEVKAGMCLAREAGPVRNAAAASLAWDEEPPSIIYWVRDGKK